MAHIAFELASILSASACGKTLDIENIVSVIKLGGVQFVQAREPPVAMKRVL